MTTTYKAVEEHRFDFVVVGGGLAGLCAAIASARKGVATAIIQDRPVFGGNASSEIRVIPFGSANFSTWARETGIIEEITLEDRANNHVDFFEHGMINRNYDLVLYEYVKREPHLKMFLNTSVRGVNSEPLDASNPKDPRRIVSIHGSQQGSEKEFIFFAKQFADCTGDGTVGFLAGATHRYGREARDEFGENMAPLKADTVTMGSTITMRARDIGVVVSYNPPDWVRIYKSADEIGPQRKIVHIQRPIYGGYWWLEVCDPPYHQIEHNQEVKDELLSHVLGVWNYIKNYSPDKEIAKTYVLDWIGMIPGKRESRRLEGDIIVMEHDVHKDRRWPDRMCISGWTIDLHIKGGILNKDEPGELSYIDDNYGHYIRTTPFTLPLRAFYSKNVENLWTAGRIISLTHVALGATRVQQIHANQGQAMGTAAAYALKHGLTPRQTANPDHAHVSTIQQQLLHDDMHILGVTNEDPTDFAREAKATATSEAPLDFGNPDTDRFVPLDKPRALIFPVTHECVDTISFHLKNANADTAILTATLDELKRIWDDQPGKQVAKVTFEIPARSEGWITADFNVSALPNTPYRVSLSKADGVGWAQAEHHPTGTTVQFFHSSPGGCEPKNHHIASLQEHEIHLPAFKRWIQDKRIALSLRITPQPQPFSAANIINGIAHPESMPNLWVSDPNEPLPQAVHLDFGEPKTFNTVLVAFDTNLNLHYTRFGALWRAPTCARDWRLHACVNGDWHMIFEEKGNYQRRRKAVFERTTATGLKLEVLATNKGETPETVQIVFEGSSHPTEGSRPAGNVALKTHGNTARVFEVRVYLED